MQKLKKPYKDNKSNVTLYGATDECISNTAAGNGNCNC